MLLQMALFCSFFMTKKVIFEKDLKKTRNSITFWVENSRQREEPGQRS